VCWVTCGLLHALSLLLVGTLSTMLSLLALQTTNKCFPAFPASSPYVTAVGGTQIVDGVSNNATRCVFCFAPVAPRLRRGFPCGGGSAAVVSRRARHPFCSHWYRWCVVVSTAAPSASRQCSARRAVGRSSRPLAPALRSCPAVASRSTPPVPRTRTRCVAA
jgi:hypothetical protein